MSGVLKTLRKYSVVIFFPTFAVSSIYADWSHTRSWKQSLVANKKTESLSQ